MRPRTFAITLLLSLSIAASLSACQTGQQYSNPKVKIQQTEPAERISNGIKADYRIADELNKIPGLQGAAVLIKDGVAYVGTHVIGAEKNNYQTEAASGMNSAVRQQAGQTVDPAQHSGDEMPRTLDSQTGNAFVPGKAATATGNLDPELAKQIEAKIKAMDPGIVKVWITSNNANVGQLQGYARYIQDGGSMDRFMQNFDQTMQRIWPQSAK